MPVVASASTAGHFSLQWVILLSLAWYCVRASPPKKLLLWEGGSHSAPIQVGRLRGEWIDWLMEMLKA